MTRKIREMDTFRVSDLDELLGHRPGLYDVENILRNATIADPYRGGRRWKFPGDRLEEIAFIVRDGRGAEGRARGFEAAGKLVDREGRAITEFRTDGECPRYVADDGADTGMAVRAAEASMLADDLCHVMVRYGVRRDAALQRTGELMEGLMGDLGFERRQAVEDTDGTATDSDLSPDAGTKVVETSWAMPDLGTVFHMEDGGTMTLGEMLEGMDEDLVPTDLETYEDMLWAYGAWSDLAEMDAALRARTYDRGLGDEIGFRATE